jgi:hypothetical protein
VPGRKRVRGSICRRPVCWAALGRGPDHRTRKPTLIVQDAGAAAWAVALAADATNGALAVTVTGEDGKTINWIARVETEELVF